MVAAFAQVMGTKGINDLLAPSTVPAFELSYLENIPDVQERPSHIGHVCRHRLDP